ncbi:MAG: hypothetical protein ACR2IS_13025, partial [Nitrososphaeraceae archaeon]
MVTLALILATIFSIDNNNVLVVDAQLLQVQNHTNSNKTILGTNTSSTNVSTSLTLTELFSRVQDSVVQVTTTSRNIAGPLSSGLGSGFVYDKDGHIITNYHVVALASLSGESSNA